MESTCVFPRMLQANTGDLVGFTSTYGALVDYTFKSGCFTSEDDGVNGKLTCFVGISNKRVANKLADMFFFQLGSFEPIGYRSLYWGHVSGRCAARS